MKGRPLRYTPRRDAGLYAYERVLEHAGFTPVAGVDEAGRGACAGPLVVAAVLLEGGRCGRIAGLADSKLLTPARREGLYDEIVERAKAWSAIVIPCHDIDRTGVHRCNVTGMRRALAVLERRPAYVLSDGFAVPGVEVPALRMIKGDQVAACVAAASIVAKVTRDRIMVELHERYPQYGFDEHKGYVTRDHSAALKEHGPCPEHRFSFVNVGRALRNNAEVVLGEAGNGLGHHQGEPNRKGPPEGQSRQGRSDGLSQEEPSDGVSRAEPSGGLNPEEPRGGVSREESSDGQSREGPPGGVYWEGPLGGSSREESGDGRTKGARA